MLKDIYRAALTALLSMAALFILTKLMGRRQVAQLSLYDYVTGITIGSIASELAVAPFSELAVPFTALVVYALLTVAMSILTDKFLWARSFITGKPAVIFDRGKFDAKVMKAYRVDVNEFLSNARSMGYFDPCDIETAILEPNGKLSILPIAGRRPANPCDLSLAVEADRVPVSVIISGKLRAENLTRAGYDEAWLQKRLKEQNSPDISEILLAQCDMNGGLNIWK